MGPAGFVAHNQLTLNPAVKAAALDTPRPFIDEEIADLDKPNAFEVMRNKCYEDLKAIMGKKPLTMNADCNLPQPMEVINALTTAEPPIVAMAAAMAATGMRAEQA